MVCRFVVWRLIGSLPDPRCRRSRFAPSLMLFVARALSPFAAGQCCICSRHFVRQIRQYVSLFTSESRLHLRRIRRNDLEHIF